jgi:hypothetical protein
LGQLYSDAGKPELAKHAFNAAREVVERMKGNLQNPSLRAGLESPMFQKIYELSAR